MKSVFFTSMCQHLVFRYLDTIWIARLRTGILLSSPLTVSLSIQYLVFTVNKPQHGSYCGQTHQEEEGEAL